MMFPHGYPRASRVFDVTSMISIFSSCHPFLPPSPPSSSSFLLGRYPLHLLRRRESVVVRWTISRDSSNATPCDARNREERERERISSGKKKKKKKIGRRSGEEERGESDGWRNAAWIRGENRVSIRMDDATRPVRIIGSIDRISRHRSVADIHVHGSTTSGPGGSP